MIFRMSLHTKNVLVSVSYDMVVRAGVAAVQAGLAELRGREAVLVLRGGGAVPPRRAPRPRAHIQDGGGEGGGKCTLVFNYGSDF